MAMSIVSNVQNVTLNNCEGISNDAKDKAESKKEEANVFFKGYRCFQSKNCFLHTCLKYICKKIYILTMTFIEINIVYAEIHIFIHTFKYTFLHAHMHMTCINIHTHTLTHTCPHIHAHHAYTYSEARIIRA